MSKFMSKKVTEMTLEEVIVEFSKTDIKRWDLLDKYRALVIKTQK